MKKILMLACLFVLGTGALMAQTTKKFVVENMHCQNCVLKVEKALKANDGVRGVDVNLASKEVTVDYDAQKITEEKMIEALKAAKFEVKLPGEQKKECSKENGTGEKACCKEKAAGDKACDKVKDAEKKDCSKCDKKDAADKKECCKAADTTKAKTAEQKTDKK